MANPDFARGLQPWGPLLRARLYALVQSIATAMYHGDLVETVSGGIVSKFGNYTSIITEAEGAAFTLVGGVLALFDEDMDPVMYVAASETGDDVVAGYALVADHHEQEFVAQATGTAISIDNCGQTVQMTNVGGTTGTGLSLMEIDGTTGSGATATNALQLSNPVPDQDVTLTNCDWICKVNTHFTRTGITGV